MTTQQWEIPLRPNQNGKIVTHKRIDNADGSKRFEFWLDGKMGLRASGVKASELPLYNWEKLTDVNEHVVITEGQKATDALLRRGVVAVGTVGAGTTPCDESLKVLHGLTVFLWPDNDTLGVAHMDKIAERLWELGNRNIRIVNWKDAPPKGDAADFKGSKEEIGELLKASTPFENPSAFKLMKFDDFLDKQDAELDWLVDGWMAVGGTSTVVAKPKVGKSTFARNLSLCVARGSDFLGRRTEQGAVIYLALEETERRVREQFRRIGATREEPIHMYVGAAPSELFEEILPHMKEIQPKLLVLDPLFRAVHVRDASAYAEVSNALDPILRVAASTGCHVLAPHHAGKQAREAVDAALGSTAISGTFDSIFVLDKKDVTRTIEVVLREGDPIPKTVLSMEADTERISLGGSVEKLTADRIMGEILEVVSDSWLERTKIEDAVEGNTRAIRSALTTLVESKKVTREGSGTKGKPFVYSEYLFSCSTPYTKTTKQESSELEPTTGDMFGSANVADVMPEREVKTEAVEDVVEI